MKTIGIIGGTSWFSTADYYKKINEQTAEVLGGSHSAKILLYSVDFSEFKAYVDDSNWEAAGLMFSDIARRLEQAGADFIVIASNTPHTIADTVSQKIGIPLLHIAEATGAAISENRVSKVGLIGTWPTMEGNFFSSRLLEKGIETLTPGKADRDYIHQAVFTELTQGIFKEDTKNRMLAIIDELGAAGAEAIIFGCTEFGLLIQQRESSLPVYDTAEIHIKAIVQYAITPETNS